MNSQRGLCAALGVAAIGLGFVIGRSERVAVAQKADAPKTNGRIGKYQITSCNTGGPASNVICLMVDTETGELWSWAPGGSSRTWEPVLPELRRKITAADNPQMSDLARLQGRWTGKTGANGLFQTTMTIKGDTCSLDNIRAGGNRIGLTGKIVINEQARPHKTIDTMNIIRYGGTGEGPDHVEGIYEFIDDDTIKICNGFNGRPTRFMSGEGGSSMVFTLKREHVDIKPGNEHAVTPVRQRLPVPVPPRPQSDPGPSRGSPSSGCNISVRFRQLPVLLVQPSFAFHLLVLEPADSWRYRPG